MVQVSRWDRLKDMAGVQQGFVEAMASLPDDVHLVLAGPEVAGVSDDPEGAAVLAECRDGWRRLARLSGDGSISSACRWTTSTRTRFW